MSGNGAEIRDQYETVIPTRTSGRAVQYTTADGSRRMLDESNRVRDWTPDDAGLPGAE